jgi:hypothetical protein
MPLQSKAQGRYLNMKFGHDWVKEHHFGGSQKGLPQHVQRGKTNVGLALFKAMQTQKKKPSRG